MLLAAAGLAAAAPAMAEAGSGRPCRARIRAADRTSWMTSAGHERALRRAKAPGVWAVGYRAGPRRTTTLTMRRRSGTGGSSAARSSQVRRGGLSHARRIPYDGADRPL